MSKEKALVNSAYLDDLDKTQAALRNAVKTLAATISINSKSNNALTIFTNTEEKRRPVTYKFLRRTQTLQSLLIYSFSDAGKKARESLAVLDLYADMHQRLIEVVEREKMPVEAYTKRVDIGEKREQLSAFRSKYKTEIARDTASESYKTDMGIIGATLDDMASAVQGKWSPKLIWVDDYCGTGEGGEVERPRSSLLSSIAAQEERGTKLETVKKLAAPTRPLRRLTGLITDNGHD